MGELTPTRAPLLKMVHASCPETPSWLMMRLSEAPAPSAQSKSLEEILNAFHLPTMTTVIGPPSTFPPRCSSIKPPACAVERVGPVPAIATPVVDRCGIAPPFSLLSTAEIPPTESMIVSLGALVKSQAASSRIAVTSAEPTRT